MTFIGEKIPTNWGHMESAMREADIAFMTDAALLDLGRGSIWQNVPAFLRDQMEDWTLRTRFSGADTDWLTQIELLLQLNQQ